jgi:predicted transcriptional regulator of viral defense system
MTTTNDIIKKFSDYPAFTYNDVKLYIYDSCKKVNIPRLLSHLKSTGRIHSIIKGAYSFSEDVMVSGFAFEPFYYGMLSALTIREWWTQEAAPEIITLRKIKKSRIKVFNGLSFVTLHHSRPNYFFGYDILKYGGISIPVSDPEKTLIDLFFYKVRLPIQSYGLLLKKIDEKKVRRYLKVYDKHTVASVEGFLKKNMKLARSGKLESPY